MTEAIYNILSNASGVTNIVSTRIYPMRLPLNTVYPAVTFQLVSDIPVNQKTGRATYFNARVQVNCYAVDTPLSGAVSAYSGNDKAIALSTAVKAALERVAPGTYGGRNVINITLLSEMDMTDDNSDYDGVYFRVIDFNVCHG